MNDWTSERNNVKLINLCLVKILSQLSNKSIRKLNEVQLLKLTLNENLLLYLIIKTRIIITSSSSFWIHSSSSKQMILLERHEHQNSWQAQCQCESLLYWKDSYCLCDFQTRRRCWSANLCKASCWCFLILSITIKAIKTSERNLRRSESDSKMSLQIRRSEAAQQVFQLFLFKIH